MPLAGRFFSADLPDADENMVFHGWEWDCAGNGPILTLKMDSDKNCTVRFKRKSSMTLFMGPIIAIPSIFNNRREEAQRCSISCRTIITGPGLICFAPGRLRPGAKFSLSPQSCLFNIPAETLAVIQTTARAIPRKN